MSEAESLALLADRPVGDLVTMTHVGLRATRLPFVYDAAVGSLGVLRGHLARGNDHWRHPAVADALVIVGGSSAYVSPSWYPSKQEHGRVVPTLDYVVVHVHGRLVVHDDAPWVRAAVEELTRVHEAGRAPAWDVDDAPPGFITGQLRGVVGVEVQISRVQGQAKLSQNKSAADRAGVVAGLLADGHDGLAHAVEAGRAPGRDVEDPGGRASD